ncbi:MAG TPA: transcriptional repressor LexA [Clostridiaceae bacterium]|nr:transcriptional repressor LexA [Clostridiaceae bacterium]
MKKEKTNKIKLNEKEKQILDFLNKQVSEKGYPPSVREICKAVGFKSTSTVHRYLERLAKHGFIHKDPTKPRALKIIHGSEKQSSAKSTDVVNSLMKYDDKGIVNIPIVGKVTAGMPILAVENIEDYFPVPSEFVQNSTVFMLRVEGESMINAGILDGDFVLVRQQNTAENGDIVVALIDDEATIKTFYKEKDHFRLQPQNNYMDPIIVKDNLKILGKVIGVFRKL